MAKKEYRPLNQVIITMTSELPYYRYWAIKSIKTIGGSKPQVSLWYENFFYLWKLKELSPYVNTVPDGINQAVGVDKYDSRGHAFIASPGHVPQQWPCCFLSF